MTFDLHIHGETPEELLAALQRLNTTPAQPQSEAVTQPDKPKAPAPVKQKKAAQKPAAAPAETQPEAKPEEPAPTDPATPEAQSPTTAEPDPAVLDKIRDLSRSLIVQGKSAEVRQLVQSTGAASISKLPPESYTAVWEGLLKLKDEVDSNAAG